MSLQYRNVCFDVHLVSADRRATARTTTFEKRAGSLNSDQVDQTALPKPKPQGVILVTEHNAEVNARFAVLRSSNHAPPLLEEDWQKNTTQLRWIPRVCYRRVQEEIGRCMLEVGLHKVSNGRDDRNMTPSECQAWIQTGLALTPFCGHAMDTSLDWAVAWSLIEEWTTRTIFLPLKGEWPWQGHPKNLLPPKEQRSVPMLTWARACFEQGSLPSLLALPGDASLLVLPGDGMFPAQRIADSKCRPVILHGYGGAKKEMPDSLAALAKFGWIPMAAAMVGTASSPPLWTGQDWRPIFGTSVDTRILPPHLSSKESLLLLSQWIRIPRDNLHIRHGTNSWLFPDKVKVALGPDCETSPHPVREVPPNISIPYIDMLLGPQKPARGHSKQATKQEELNTLPAPEEVLVTLRLQVDSCGPSDVSALIQILLGGSPIRCRNHHLWIQAVQDYFDDVPLYVPCCQLLRFVCETAPQQGCKVSLAPPDGSYCVGDLEALCRGSVPFPDSGVHVHIRPADAVVGSASGEDPQLVNIDCTGLGGHDLGGFKDYDICLRTDKHSQSIYGPSVTPLESPGRDGTHQVTLVALGGSKAMHEFLVLHYLATDSAMSFWTAAYLCAHGYVLAVDGRLPYICTTSATLPHPTDGLPIPLGLREWSWCLICYSVPVNTGIWADAWLIPDLLKSMWEDSRLAPIVAFVYCISCGTCPMFRWEAFWEASPVPRHCYMVFYQNMVTVSC